MRRTVRLRRSGEVNLRTGVTRNTPKKQPPLTTIVRHRQSKTTGHPYQILIITTIRPFRIRCWPKRVIRWFKAFQTFQAQESNCTDLTLNITLTILIEPRVPRTPNEISSSSIADLSNWTVVLRCRTNSWTPKTASYSQRNEHLKR